MQYVAFPAISCGVYAYPPAAAARVALNAIRRVLAEDPAAASIVRGVYFALFEDRVLRAFIAEADALFPQQPEGPPPA